ASRSFEPFTVLICQDLVHDTHLRNGDTPVLVLYRMVPQPAYEPKAKLAGASKLACLRNFLEVLGGNEIVVSGDCLDERLCVEIARLKLELVRQQFQDGPKN